MGLMSEAVTQFVIPASTLVGIAFALLQWFLVSRVAVSTKASGYKGYHDRLIQQDHEEDDEGDTLDNIIKCAEIQNAISVGATSFLFTEYKYLSIFRGNFLPVRRQFNTIPELMEGTAKPDYANCVKISTNASLGEMIPPGALVMLTPLVAGTLFGVETLAGVLAGLLVSGVQAGSNEHAKALDPKGSDAHKVNLCIGDTIGDPLKDTSGPREVTQRGCCSSSFICAAKTTNMMY